MATAEALTVIVPPAWVDGVAARIVALPDGAGQVETFISGKWVVGGATVPSVLKGLPLSDDEIAVLR